MTTAKLTNELKAIERGGFEIAALGAGRDNIPKWRVNRPDASVENFAYFDEEGIKALAKDVADDNARALTQKVPKAVKKTKRAKGEKSEQSIVTNAGSFRTALTFNPNRIRRMIKRELKEHIAASDKEAARFREAGASAAVVEQFLEKYKKPAEAELKGREDGSIVRLGRAALPDSTPDSQLPPFSPKAGQDTGLRKALAQQRKKDKPVKKEKAASTTGATKAAAAKKAGVKKPAAKAGKTPSAAELAAAEKRGGKKAVETLKAKAAAAK